MAQSRTVNAGVYKIQSPTGTTTYDSGPTTAGATKNVVIAFGTNTVVFQAVPARTGSTSTNDTLISTSDGWNFWCIQEYADVATALSATDWTSS